MLPAKGDALTGLAFFLFPESAERKVKAVWSWWGKEAWGRLRAEERQKATAGKRTVFRKTLMLLFKGASNISRATFLKCQQKIISVVQWFNDQQCCSTMEEHWAYMFWVQEHPAKTQRDTNTNLNILQKKNEENITQSHLT